MEYRYFITEDKKKEWKKEKLEVVIGAEIK